MSKPVIFPARLVGGGANLLARGPPSPGPAPTAVVVAAHRKAGSILRISLRCLMQRQSAARSKLGIRAIAEVGDAGFLVIGEDRLPGPAPAFVGLLNDARQRYG